MKLDLSLVFPGLQDNRCATFAPRPKQEDLIHADICAVEF